MRTFFRIFTTLVLILVCVTKVNSARIKNIAPNLVGEWKIYDENNNPISSINIELVAARKKQARFNYHEDGKESESNQGLLVGDNKIIFELFELGSTQTYIAELNFEAGGGPGVEINTQFADCQTVGLDKTLVAKKFRKKLSANSARCNSLNSLETQVRKIKLAKADTSPNQIPSENEIDSSIASAETKFSNLLNGAWRANSSGNSNRLLIKDIQTNFLGQSFTFRIIDKSIALSNLNQSNFRSVERNGYIVDNYLLINTSEFNKQNELFVTKIKNKKGNGKLFLTTYSECVPLKRASAGTKICTPIADLNNSKKNSNTRIRRNARLRKINSNVQISF